jgi:uncharacterized membrane protein YesL
LFTPLRLLPRAIRLWWREFAFLIVLNFIWLLCQLTVVLGGPATAGLVYIGRRVVDGELIGLDDFWHGVKRNFAAGLRWMLLQVLVYGVLGFNLWFYAGREGVAVLSLRYAWTIMGLVWFAINLYYWPLHFEQADRRFRTTLSNATKMAFLNPNATILYTVAALLLIVVCVGTGVLLGFALGAWLSLWGGLVVRAACDGARYAGLGFPPRCHQDDR